MRLHRLIAILLLIESRGTVKAKDLSDALEVSLRTIYRDIDTLCESGVPLITTPGPQGGVSFINEYRVDFHHFYGDEVIQLYLTGMSIKPSETYDARLKLQNTLLKLEKNLPQEFKSDILKVKSRIFYDATPWWGEVKDYKFLERLRQAVLQSIKIEMTYEKIHHEKSTRIVLPYGLVAKQLDWYLICLDESVKDFRIFKCERIKEVSLLNEKFEIDDNFSIETYWQQASEQFKKIKKQTEIYPVKLKVKKENKFILRDLEIYDTEAKVGFLYVTVNMYKYEFACIEALERIGFVEVIEPLELRQYVKKALTERLSLY